MSNYKNRCGSCGEKIRHICTPLSMLKKKLKAHFAAQIMNVIGESECCGIGSESGMSLEKINETIDSFNEEKIK